MSKGNKPAASIRPRSVIAEKYEMRAGGVYVEKLQFGRDQ